jgi:hypothetical protein
VNATCAPASRAVSTPPPSATCTATTDSGDKERTRRTTSRPGTLRSRSSTSTSSVCAATTAPTVPAPSGSDATTSTPRSCSDDVILSLNQVLRSPMTTGRGDHAQQAGRSHQLLVRPLDKRRTLTSTRFCPVAGVGDDNPWLATFDARRALTSIPPVRELVKDNAHVAKTCVAGRLAGSPTGSPEELEPKDAAIVKLEGKQTAFYRDEQGRLHRRLGRLHAHEVHGRLERRRDQLRLPVPRVALQSHRRGPARASFYAAGATRVPR